MASIMEEEPGAVLAVIFFRGWRATPVYKFMYKIGRPNVVLLRL